MLSHYSPVCYIVNNVFQNFFPNYCKQKEKKYNNEWTNSIALCYAKVQGYPQRMRLQRRPTESYCLYFQLCYIDESLQM